MVLLGLAFYSTLPSLLYAQTNCSFTINNSTNIFDGTAVLPGDTICLDGGLRTYLLLKNIVGTASQPIIIINSDSKSIIDTDHFYGIKFSGCKHVKLTGTSSSTNPYGIKINRVGNGAGISIDDLSTNIEIAHVEIANTALGGIYAKTDPNCSFVATRDKFTMFDIRIHDCYLHDILDEGMYIGSSKFTGQYLQDCDTTVLPHVIHGVHIYNNIVERTGWDGIQVSSAPSDCRIFNNIIRNDSYRETPNQMSGILVGGGSVCDCYNNQIFDGKGDGMDIFGSGTMKIYNNLIVRAGITYLPDNPNAARHGVFIGNAPDASAATLHLLHNTIVSPKTTGIRFFNSNTTNNLVMNNIITNPGSYASNDWRAYFNSDLPEILFSLKNNIFTENTDPLKFSNYSNDNFDLQANSTAVNNGFFAGLNAISFDILNRPRPHNNGYDIGAFESQDTYAGEEEFAAKNMKILVWPNPAITKLFVTIHSPYPQSAAIQIDDILGNHCYLKPHLSLDSGTNLIEVSIEHWRQGVYFLYLHNDRSTSSIRFLVINPF